MATTYTWQTAFGASRPIDLSKPFTITAYPKSDIWRRSLTDDVFNAPSIYTSLSPSTFKRISVTVSGPWKTQYDQGGLVLSSPAQDSRAPMRWIKAGIEFFNGKPVLGVVGCDRFSDWSLAPLPEGVEEATFEAVREGVTLWVYAVVQGERVPLREVKWAFIDFEGLDGDGKDGKGEGTVDVGVYAAKPTPDEGDEEGKKGVAVQFKDLVLESHR
jgi:uncharacterized protein